jgi:chromate reductase
LTKYHDQEAEVMSEPNISTSPVRPAPHASHIGARPEAAGPALRVLTISGSLRRGSYNRRLLHEAADHAPTGVALHEWAELHAVPAFDEDLESDPPEAVAELREAIRAADAVLIATPEYNGSVPGALKNALDWASRPYKTTALRGKPVAVVGASPSPRGAQAAQDDLRRILGVIGADVVESGFAVASVHERLGADGTPGDEALGHQLHETVDSLARSVAGTQGLAA